MVSILKWLKWSNFGWFGGSIIFWKPHIWRYGKMKMVMIQWSMKQITWITWMFKSFKLRKRKTGGHLHGNWLLDGRVLWLAQPLPQRDMVRMIWNHLVHTACLDLRWQQGQSSLYHRGLIGFPDVTCKFDTGPFRPYIWFMAEGFLCYHCALYLSSIVCTLVAWLPSCNA